MKQIVLQTTITTHVMVEDAEVEGMTLAEITKILDEDPEHFGPAPAPTFIDADVVIAVEEVD